MTEQTAAFWDDLYGRSDRIWAGKANVALVELVGTDPVGRALDLGCGEGGDAIWLAGLGWRVTAVDVSEVALARALTDAVQVGVAEQISFERRDLATDFPSGRYELVSAPFLQSPLDFPRAEVLRSAAAAVQVGGLLVIVEHASAPPWSEHARDEFPTAEQTLAGLQLAPDRWRVERCATQTRIGTGPECQTAELLDNVIAVRRLS